MAIANKTCVSGKKAEGWRYVLAVEAFYLYAKLIFGRPLRVNFVSTRKTGNYYHKRRLFTNTSAMLSKYSFVYSVYLFIPAGVRVSLCRPNNVEFSRHAEKSTSYLQRCTFWPPCLRPWDNRGKCHMDEKRIQCLSKHRSMYPSIFNISQ